MVMSCPVRSHAGCHAVTDAVTPQRIRSTRPDPTRPVPSHLYKSSPFRGFRPCRLRHRTVITSRSHHLTTAGGC